VRKRSLAACGLLLAAAMILVYQGCNTGTGGQVGGDGGNGDGWNSNCDGPNCPVKPPCSNPTACNTCTSTGCLPNGSGSAFPIDPAKDPNVKAADGVKLDPNGDIVLDDAAINFNYMWIANTYDLAGSATCGNSTVADPSVCRGSVSKIDTVNMKEVGRYFSVTCSSKGGATGCLDVNGLPITLNHRHTPSRTAVDFNFDVWVANRSVHGGQPSATKIANDPADCIDRNKNGKIETSKDQNGDGKITVDCDGDGKPDNASTVCTGALAGKTPEFLGDDDECILFTTNYADENDIGRSICLDSAKANVGASTAWVGSFFRPENGRGNNRFYGINGTTGKIDTVVEMPPNHHSYGCTADGSHIVWSTDIGYTAAMYPPNGWPGSLAYFKTTNPFTVGPQLLRGGPSASTPWTGANGGYHHYGIAVNMDQHIWLGGIWSEWTLRYKPNRTSFDTLGQGTWTRIDMPSGFMTRGIAPDSRGKVWAAVNDGGYIIRFDQSITDGVHDQTKTAKYWPLTANTVIGAGVDFNGNIWGIGQANNTASRLDVDKNGEVILPATGQTKAVAVGQAPYTYSDFTGYGLLNFIRPQGRYVYQLKACTDGTKATWTGAYWKATTPAGTSVTLRVRSGDSDTTFGSWSTEFTSPPAEFGPKKAAAISPNPSVYLQVEFTLKNTTKNTTPILHDYGILFYCGTPS
jgi:hypothetical protein